MIRLRQVKLPIDDNNYKSKIASLLKISESDIKNIIIKKKSLDARDKNNLLFVYEFDCIVDNEKSILKRNKSKDIFLSNEKKYSFVPVISNNKKIVVVGSGPAGLFCAYMLASNGIKPIVIERGERVEDRVKSVENFWKSNKLNINSNVQFGEGGAGTFSDGKLTTTIKDSENRISKVLEIFVENGAPEEILYEAKPHIGTDILRDVVINMRNKIISLGGEFLYNTKLTDINIKNNNLYSILVNDKDEIKCDALVLAIGHSARDTFKMLNNLKFNMVGKPFAVGVRIEHLQKMINKSQYGVEYSKYLSPASYKLTYQCKNGRGVYSFCMCPGGYVVNASSEEGMLAVNGMSYAKRDSDNANSAIIVTVGPNDYGNNPLDGVMFQQELEKKAYILGNGKIPIQLFGDYKNKVVSNNLNYPCCVKGDYTFADLNNLFPNYINESLKEAIDNFGLKIDGFNREDSILLGVESRTSSPVRIIRDDNLESNYNNIYPCGEGAGYAGGITSSAVDGIKVAEKIALKHFSKR